MPIRPEMRPLYPPDWNIIADTIKAQRGYRCEKCGQQDSLKSGIAKGNNYLTVHHNDHNPANCDQDNLIVLCARCHLRQEVKDQVLARHTRLIKDGQLSLSPKETTW